MFIFPCISGADTQACSDSTREIVSINAGWRFMKYTSSADSDELIYDVRPEVGERRDDQPADTQPTEAVDIESRQTVLKPWILPTANDYIKDPAKHFIRPQGDPGSDFPFVQNDFDDSGWELLDLPHDWAIEGPFFEGFPTPVGGGMGRLPSPGVAWYRKKLDISQDDEDKRIYLDIDGAMSYSMVWLNGHLVGGWPYGYASFRLDLTPYVEPGGDNQLAIRLDNPPESARWYPGGGLYRNVWLVKTHPVHVAHHGTFVTTPNVSKETATVNIEVKVDNESGKEAPVEMAIEVFVIDASGKLLNREMIARKKQGTPVPAGGNAIFKDSVTINNPRLWGPPPNQEPNLYLARITLFLDRHPVDSYTTRFGIRSIQFNADEGVIVNGERIFIKGVNQHHDLGALGAAFNIRAAERQLEILREMGCNAIRMSHNPPAPELLDLTDQMGFLVMDEIFDVWERKKPPLDFHLIFPDWSEADVRLFIRRDRNHPSVFSWSYGNEVGEQYTGEAGAAVSKRLFDMVKEEDPTRPATASMNFAKPDFPFARVMDLVTLNYQGEGIRNAPAYAHLKGINTHPLYGEFHKAFPDTVIISSENASALSTRGTYLFPVFDGISAPIRDGSGGDPVNQYVSSYELHTADFGSSADKVFKTVDDHPYIAGGFVWTGWDYIGEPTPYYGARSSYCGIIDLAGFKKDRFYLYQARWRPELPMAHILPHWNWPERTGEVTPVHVFTSGDEVELFLNGRSLGRKAKGAGEYRLRWDNVLYQPGTLEAVAYKNGEYWASATEQTTGAAAAMHLSADRRSIRSDGLDLCFVTVKLLDKEGLFVRNSDNELEFSIEGPGEILATDNGDPTSFTPFQSTHRKAFNGLCLVIIKGLSGEPGKIELTASGKDLKTESVIITTHQSPF